MGAVNPWEAADFKAKEAKTRVRNVATAAGERPLRALVGKMLSAYSFMPTCGEVRTKKDEVLLVARSSSVKTSPFSCLSPRRKCATSWCFQPRKFSHVVVPYFLPRTRGGLVGSTQ